MLKNRITCCSRIFTRPMNLIGKMRKRRLGDNKKEELPVPGVGGGKEEEGISAGSTWAGPGEGVNMTKARVLDHSGEEGAWGVI